MKWMQEIITVHEKQPILIAQASMFGDLLAKMPFCLPSKCNRGSHGKSTRNARALFQFEACHDSARSRRHSKVLRRSIQQLRLIIHVIRQSDYINRIYNDRICTHYQSRDTLVAYERMLLLLEMHKPRRSVRRSTILDLGRSETPLEKHTCRNTRQSMGTTSLAS